MSHRRKKAPEKGDSKEVRKSEQIDEEPYILDVGPSRLVLRGNELYNGWDGNCPKCNSFVQKERPAAEGLRCPECDYWLYRPGNKRDREGTIREMRARRDGSLDKESMSLSHQEEVMLEMGTGICHLCGGKMVSEHDEYGFTMYCPNCLKNIPQER